MGLDVRPVLHTLLAPLRYLISGGSATVLHWATMAGLVAYGMSPTLSTAVGALVGAALNYVLQFHFTFRSTHSHRTTLPRYFQVTALSWISNSVLFFMLFQLTTLSISTAQLLTTALITFLNFFLYQRLVFHESDKSTLNA